MSYIKHIEQDFLEVEVDSYNLGSNLSPRIIPQEPRIIIYHCHPLDTHIHKNTKEPPEFNSMPCRKRYSVIYEVLFLVTVL